MDRIAQSHDNFKEAIWQMFLLMTENGNLMKNTFKIFLSGFTSRVEPSEKSMIKKCGPPGDEVLAKMVKQAAQVEISKPALDWAVQSIFTNLSHTALITTTDFYKRMIEELEAPLPKNHFEHAIKLHGRALISFLKNNSEDLKALPNTPLPKQK